MFIWWDCFSQAESSFFTVHAPKRKIDRIHPYIHPQGPKLYGPLLLLCFH